MTFTLFALCPKNTYTLYTYIYIYNGISICYYLIGDMGMGISVSVTFTAGVSFLKGV